MNYEIGMALNVGIKRLGKENQDAIGSLLPGFFNHRPPLFVLADGMGGYNGGQIASDLVVQSILKSYRRSKKKEPSLEVLKNGVRKAHEVMKKKADKKGELAKMGSTVVAAIVEQAEVSLINVGDSRAYLINETEIRRISWDHSFVAEQVRRGLITEQEANHHPKRNVLTMSINANRHEIEIFENNVFLNLEDTLLLCSDGLWGPVSEAQIQAVVMEMSAQQAADKLVELANTNQGPDNISVIICRRK